MTRRKTVGEMTDVDARRAVKRAMKAVGWGDKYAYIERQPDGGVYISIHGLPFPLVMSPDADPDPTRSKP